MEETQINPSLAPFIVEGLLIVAAAVFGFLIGNKGKPYGKVKLIFHLFFVAWFTVGMVFILLGTIKAVSSLVVPVALMGVALLIEIIVGTRMLASKEVGKTLPTVHTISATVMLLSDIGALIITAVR